MEQIVPLVQDYIQSFTWVRAGRWFSTLWLSYVSFYAGNNPNPDKTENDKAVANDKLFVWARGHTSTCILQLVTHTAQLVYHLYNFGDEPFTGVELAIYCGAMAFLQFRLWAMRTLGRYFTFQLMIRKDHKLLGDGPYTYLVHPSYTGMVFGNPLACQFFTRAPRLVAAVTAAYLVVLVARLRDEEKALSEHFKEEYVKFCATRWRLIPFVY